MKSVIIASTNPVKIEATRLGFWTMLGEGDFHFEGVATASGVSSQPMGDEETLHGAVNRARSARVSHPEADFWVGIEGGVEDTPFGMYAFAWVVVLSTGLTGRARTGIFQLPPAVARLVRQGLELGKADDLIFQRQNSKQKDGAIGLLSEGVLTRTTYYQHAVMLALVPFKKAELYKAI